MQTSNLDQPRDESTKSLHDYLSNNNYKNLISFSLIFMFSMVFYFIYLIVDSFIDKNKHFNYSILAYEDYEAGKRRALAEKNRKKKRKSCVDTDDKINEQVHEITDDNNNNNNNNNEDKTETSVGENLVSVSSSSGGDLLKSNKDSYSIF